MMLADLVMLSSEHPYVSVTAITALCAYVIWNGTR